MSCKLVDKCENVFACNILRPDCELLGCNFYKPKEPQTNEEWFCSLSTEEKAEWLSNRDEFIYDCGQRSVTPKIMDKDEWKEWLKQPHTTKE